MSRRQESEQLKKCVEYFRQNSVWEKVLNGFFEKYASYGRFSGSVRVQSLSPEELEQQLKLSAEIFNKLPYRKTQKIYLAVFAAMVTGNPHAFDQGTVGGRLLYQIIQRNLELRNLIIGQIETFPAYKRQRSFLAAGILLDDVSNSVMLYRVEAVKKDGDMHSGVAGFQKEQDILQIPLGVITDWKEVRMLAAENFNCGKSICFCNVVW